MYVLMKDYYTIYLRELEAFFERERKEREARVLEMKTKKQHHVSINETT
jgi:hypothetical protein